MRAYPTVYNDVQFRSRLEARWAAFFDILKFKWAYEPFDLNGYIPDFLLFDAMLVEVKPILWKNRIGGGGLVNAHSQREYEHAIRKFASSRHDFKWIAIVGADIHDYTGTGRSALAGKVWSAHVHAGEWRDLHLDCWPSNDEVSFDAQPILGSNGHGDIDLISSWREAGNRVQWRGHAAQRHTVHRHADVVDFLEQMPPPDEPDLDIWKFNPEIDIP